MDIYALWMIAVIGAGCLAGVFVKMKGGFGPFNLRAVGLVLVAVFATLLALTKTDSLNAALGILGAIAGYLFGADSSKLKEPAEISSVAAAGATFGDNAKLAGRDIHETVNQISARVRELGNLINTENAKLDRLIEERDSGSGRTSDYLVNTVYERGLREAGGAMRSVISRWEGRDWKLIGMSSDYQGMDGVFLLFERPSIGPTQRIHVIHGSNGDDIDAA